MNQHRSKPHPPTVPRISYLLYYTIIVARPAGCENLQLCKSPALPNSFSLRLQRYCIERRKSAGRRLDMASAVPATATLGSGSIESVVVFLAAHPQGTDESRDEPEKGREEGKRYAGFEPATKISPRSHITPVKDAATAAVEALSGETTLLACCFR